METLIPKEEYELLKKMNNIDFDLIKQFENSLIDLREKKFKRVV